MKRGRQSILLFALILLTACGAQPSQATPQLVKVYATSAASSRLTDLYNCSNSSTAIFLSDPQSADITLQLGPPDALTTPAFQVGTDDIEVTVQSQNTFNNLTVDQVHSIFLGQIVNWKDVGGVDSPIQAWAYARDEDIQQIFEKNVMDNQQVTSSARLAVSAQNMLDSISKDSNAIGFLPRSLETSNMHAVYKVASAPILAITRSQPQGVIKDLITCLQK